MHTDVASYIKKVTGEPLLNRAAKAFGKEIDKRGATVEAAHFRGAFPAYWLPTCLEAAKRKGWPPPPLTLFAKRRSRAA